jgi:hypothetical protein
VQWGLDEPLGEAMDPRQEEEVAELGGFPKLEELALQGVVDTDGDILRVEEAAAVQHKALGPAHIRCKKAAGAVVRDSEEEERWDTEHVVEVDNSWAEDHRVAEGASLKMDTQRQVAADIVHHTAEAEVVNALVEVDSVSPASCSLEVR